MAVLKRSLRRKNATGNYDTIRLESDSSIVYRPSGRTVEQDLAAYLPSTQSSDVVPKTLNHGKIITGQSRLFAGVLDNIVELETIPSNRIDTSDATAMAEHILSGYTAYARGEKITGSLVPETIPNSLFSGKIMKFASNLIEVTIPDNGNMNLIQYDILFQSFSYGTKYGSDMIFILYDLSIGCGISCVYGSYNQNTEISGDSVTMIIDRYDVKLASISEKVGKNLYMYTDFHSGDGNICIRLKFDNKIVYNTDTTGNAEDRFYVLSYSS